MSFKATAPGSLMLLGEYAVLHGKPAVVCAVDKRIQVVLTPRADQRIIIQSHHGNYETELSLLTLEKPYHFVLGALHQFRAKLRRGCDLHITTEFSDQIGFGSSAAVTVATIAAVAAWLDMRMIPLDILRHARHVIRNVQGIGSGADAAAAIYGGVIAYQQHPLQAEKFAITYPLTVLYAGFKTPTAEAIQQVQQRFASHAILFRHLMTSIGQCATDGILQLRKKNWQGFGEMMTIQQGLMTALGVNVPALQTCLDQLQQSSHIIGAKISGSGLGDCVVGLGQHDLPQAIPIAMTTQGVQCEEI